MELENGTYLKLGANEVVRIETNQGYWVATKEVSFGSLNSLAVFGVWVDDTGKRWLDLVSYIEDLDTAKAMGNRYGQLAIYDNKNKETIDL
jgi:hypothetical protein